MSSAAGTRERLEECLRRALQPVHLEIVDDSARHLGHAGRSAAGGGHFQVMVVSRQFEGLSVLEQHRMVNGALTGLMGGEIHALGLRTMPASEWQPEPTAPDGVTDEEVS